METRDILDAQNNVIGQLSLPEDTPEDIWTEKLSLYQYVIPTPTAQQTVEALIKNAIIFGQNLMTTFAAQNVLMGITQANMTGTVRTVLAQVQSALLSGGLYDAITQLKAIPAESKDGVFITDARLLEAVNDIETYLKIPLSGSL